MKVCIKCNVSKSKSEFYRQRQISPNGVICHYFDSCCKTCRKEYSRLRSIAIKKKAVEYLGGKCADCGLVDIPCVYDFHHLDASQKELSFGSRGGKSFKSLKPELDKCVVLCANCHRKRHQND